jgi:hypothetical protein
MVVNAIAVAIMVPATLYLVPLHGAIAAAWIWVAINAGYVVFSISVMHRRILVAEKWHWYLRDVFGPLVPVLLAVAALAMLHERLPPATRAGELAFLVLALAAATLSALLATATGQALLKAAMTRMLSPGRT